MSICAAGITLRESCKERDVRCSTRIPTHPHTHTHRETRVLSPVTASWTPLASFHWLSRQCFAFPSPLMRILQYFKLSPLPPLLSAEAMKLPAGAAGCSSSHGATHQQGGSIGALLFLFVFSPLLLAGGGAVCAALYCQNRFCGSFFFAPSFPFRLPSYVSSPLVPTEKCVLTETRTPKERAE